MKKSSSTSSSKKATTRKSNSSSANTEPLSVNSQISAGVRKIENGFIVSESGYVGSGKNQRYENKEYFSPTNPVAGV